MPRPVTTKPRPRRPRARLSCARVFAPVFTSGAFAFVVDVDAAARTVDEVELVELVPGAAVVLVVMIGGGSVLVVLDVLEETGGGMVNVVLVELVELVELVVLEVPGTVDVVLEVPGTVEVVLDVGPVVDVELLVDDVVVETIWAVFVPQLT
jgi:hypothetical protein